MKTVQKCLNKSISNRTITKQEAMCQVGKLPLVICSESIDTISLSGVVRVKETESYNYKTLISRYNTRTMHLDKSLHEYFHITKNHNPKKEFVPHYVGGGGQPTYPVSKNYARVEMLKHIPWSKTNPLPEMNDTNILEIFEEFRRSDHCPISVNIALERAKHKIEMRKKGFKEPIGEEIEESQNIDSDLDQETKDLVNLANNLSEQSNIFDSLEQQGLDIGREYDWCKRFHEVSSSA